MPKLRRLDMRVMMPENLPSAASAANSEPRHHYLPPPPAVVPNLLWLGIGFYYFGSDPTPIERVRPRDLDLSALVPAGSLQPYRHLRSLVLEGANLDVEGICGDKDEEVRRLLIMLPVVFPSLRMIHVHCCIIGSAAERVLGGLADAYAAANRAASAGARGAAAAASSSPSSDDGRSFRGVCRGCPA